jgi:hypothetical protein
MVWGGGLHVGIGVRADVCVYGVGEGRVEGNDRGSKNNDDDADVNAIHKHEVNDV